MEAYHSMNRRTTGLTSSYPRNAPSRELIEAVSAMKAEVQWSKLEDDGAYVIITPIAPYYMLWATKRWTQVMGYFVNDLLGLDISLLFGPKTDVMALLSLLSTMITGHSLHIMVRIILFSDIAPLLHIHLFRVRYIVGMVGK